MNKVLRNKILKEISPTNSEEKDFEKKIKVFISSLEKSSKNLGFDCSFFVGGSFGKGTYLKGDFDIDVFARFSKKYVDSKLSFQLEEILKDSKTEFQKLKGSRDYFEVRQNGLKFEVIPVFEIKKIEEAKNTTDISPLHVLYLKKKSLKNKELQNEIRLAKQFFKSKGLYGAESYINGFSGHSIDILVSYYGTFEKLVLSAKNWQEDTFIDITKTYKSISEAKKEIAKDKQSSLILVDSLNPLRNAARALNSDLYNKFIFECQLAKDFSESDFRIKKISILKKVNDLKKRAKMMNLCLIYYEFNFDTKNKSLDIVGSQLLKLFKKIENYYQDLDFKLFEKEFCVDSRTHTCLCVYYFEKSELSSMKKLLGPFVWMQDSVKEFVSRYKDYTVEGNRVYAYTKRKYVSLKKVPLLKIKDCKKLFQKDISFITSLKGFRFF